MDFVGGGDGALQARHDLHGELETEIHALGADVKEQVAGRGDGVARAGAKFTKGMKFRRARRAEEAVPGVGTEAHDAGESGFKIAKTHGAQKARRDRRREKGPERDFRRRGLIVTTRKIAALVSGERDELRDARCGCR